MLPNGSNNPPISLGDISAEFGLGGNISSYYGARFFRPDNSRSYFQGSGTISLSDFYSKGRTSPVSPGSATFYGSQVIGFPMFNNLTVTVVSGQGGTAGQGGNCDGGGPGGNGGATAFGNYVGTGEGPSAGYGGTGGRSSNSTSWSINDANQASILALYYQGVYGSVGGGGSAGREGGNKKTYCACAYGFCICVDNNCDSRLSGGNGGAGGYISLSWN